MWMGKRTKNCSRVDFLDMKTGIDVYRGIILVILSSLLSGTIAASIYYRGNMDLFVLILLDIIFMLLSIFIDKVVYIFRLPTNHLIVTKNEIVFKKGKKRFVYKVNETSYKFHSFFEDFESLSQIHIFSKDKEHYIQITKKQYKMMVEFLEKKDN